MNNIIYGKYILGKQVFFFDSTIISVDFELNWFFVVIILLYCSKATHEYHIIFTAKERGKRQRYINGYLEFSTRGSL